MNMKCSKGLFVKWWCWYSHCCRVNPSSYTLFGLPSGELGLGVNPRIIVDLPRKDGWNRKQHIPQVMTSWWIPRAEKIIPHQQKDARNTSCPLCTLDTGQLKHPEKKRKQLSFNSLPLMPQLQKPTTLGPKNWSSEIKTRSWHILSLLQHFGLYRITPQPMVVGQKLGYLLKGTARIGHIWCR